MQQGDYVAGLLKARLQGQKPERRLSTRIRATWRSSAVMRPSPTWDLRRFSGFCAWLIWIFVHIRFLIEFDNKLLVLTQWAWNYFTRRRGARLITGRRSVPPG